MKMNRVLDYVLWVIVLFGFFGAAKISYDNFNGSPCPALGPVPVCYVVLVAYGLMAAAMVISQRHCKHYFFVIGWGVAFTIALVGSLAEFFAGGVRRPDKAPPGAPIHGDRRFSRLALRQILGPLTPSSESLPRSGCPACGLVRHANLAAFRGLMDGVASPLVKLR